MSVTEATRGLCNCCLQEFTNCFDIAGHACPPVGNMVRNGVVCPVINTGSLPAFTTESGVFVKISLVSATNTWYLLVTLPKSIDLGQLDQFLRNVWCGCDCGHLSHFVCPENPKESLSFNKKVIELSPKILYEFDFGNPCIIQIERLYEVKLNVVMRDAAAVMARNLLPIGYSSKINSPRAICRCELSDEVLSMKTVFQLPAGCGDSGSRMYAQLQQPSTKTIDSSTTAMNNVTGIGNEGDKPARVDAGCPGSVDFELVQPNTNNVSTAKKKEDRRSSRKRTRTISQLNSSSSSSSSSFIENDENQPPATMDDDWLNFPTEFCLGQAYDEPGSFGRGRRRCKSVGGTVPRRQRMSEEILTRVSSLAKDGEGRVEMKKVLNHIFVLFPEMKQEFRTA